MIKTQQSSSSGRDKVILDQPKGSLVKTTNEPIEFYQILLLQLIIKHSIKDIFVAEGITTSVNLQLATWKFPEPLLRLSCLGVFVLITCCPWNIPGAP
jgi:hypothetical protein